SDAVPAMGIESLQKMGTKFILCNNALGLWVLELEARGKGKAADIDKELRANVLPGVTIVPAMVIAIDQAQEAGSKYNRQQSAETPSIRTWRTWPSGPAARALTNPESHPVTFAPPSQSRAPRSEPDSRTWPKPLRTQPASRPTAPDSARRSS